MEKQVRTINYKLIFLLGISLMLLGVIFSIFLNPGSGVSLIGVGVLFEIVGLANREKWR